LAYCKIYFPLIKHSYDKNGRSTGSKLDQLQSVAKMIKKPIPELVALENIPVDDTILYILDIFYSIKRSEQLTYTELKNYCSLVDMDLDAEEVTLIMDIDNIYNRSMR
jgi:hypothetical protein